MTDPMPQPASTWNFDLTRMSARDLNACLFFLEHQRMPSDKEISDEPTDLDGHGTGRELALIELAALYAHAVLWYTGHGDLGGGRLPDSVNPNAYEGLDDVGAGISLEACYVDNRLIELAPILIKYDFTK